MRLILRARNAAGRHCQWAIALLLLVGLPAGCVPSRITGRVINRSRNEPSGADDVVLYNVGQTMVEMARTKTGPDGSFRFDTSGNFPYLVAVFHQNVSYHTKTLHGSGPVEVVVYDTAHEVQGVRNESNTLFVNPSTGTVNITEFFVISNQSNPPRTLAGGKTFSFLLPDGAMMDSTLIQPPGTLPLRVSASTCGQSRRYCLTYPIRPGSSRLRVVYHLKQSETGWITLPSSSAAKSVAVMVPESLQLEPRNPGALEKRDTQSGLSMYVATETHASESLVFRLSGGTGTGTRRAEAASLGPANLLSASAISEPQPARRDTQSRHSTVFTNKILIAFLASLVLMAMIVLVSHLRIRRSAVCVVVAMLCLLSVRSVATQPVNLYHRTLTVSVAEPVVLDIDLLQGEVQVLYSRDGQVSITATQKPSTIGELKTNLAEGIALDQNGNHIKLGHVPSSSEDVVHNGVLYRIDVPYRTTVTARLGDGNITVTGVMGPVVASTGRGDINASYISKEVSTEAGTGNLDLQVIGARVEAKTGSGKISCSRATQGVSAETQDGDITLVVVGPSTANVKTGSGRINIGGARGSLLAETHSGELHVKAVPQGDWQLRSATGNVRVELPAGAKFEVDAASQSGEISVARDDAKLEADNHQLHQAVNGGGARIQMSTESGKIAIQ